MVTSACVSPRWKIAEPCMRGSTPTSQSMLAQATCCRGRRCACRRGSGRGRLRSSSGMPGAAELGRRRMASAAVGSGIISATIRSLSSLTASARACLPVGLLGRLKSS